MKERFIMTTIKRKSTFLVTLGLLFVFLFNFTASAMESDRELIMKDMPESLKQIILQHEAEGKEVEFQTEASALKSRARQTTYLPSGSYTEERTSKSGENWTLNRNFSINSPCSMEVFLTTTINGEYVPCTITVTGDGRTQIKNVTASPGVTDAFSFNVVDGCTYNVTITPKKTGSTIIAYVYGE